MVVAAVGDLEMGQVREASHKAEKFGYERNVPATKTYFGLISPKDISVKN